MVYLDFIQSIRQRQHNLVKINKNNKEVSIVYGDDNSINVNVRRIGGGFGGKETQSFIFAAISTLLAKKIGNPIKLRIDRDDDMIIFAIKSK